jgi:hypothetical protein
MSFVFFSNIFLLVCGEFQGGTFPRSFGPQRTEIFKLSKKVLKSRQIGFLKGTDQMTVNRGFFQ